MLKQKETFCISLGRCNDGDIKAFHFVYLIIVNLWKNDIFFNPDSAVASTIKNFYLKAL